jgi:hypothetical protein
MAAAHPVGASQPAVRVIVFSKDRSFQLHETLRSLRDNVVAPSCTPSSPSEAPPVSVDVRVLFKVSSPAFRDSYSAIAAQFAGDSRYEFVEEHDFAAQIVELVAGTSRGDTSDQFRFVLFTVDDALFCRPFQLGEAASLLLEDPGVFCYHVKMHPAVTYSHPADKVVDPPPFRDYNVDRAAVASHRAARGGSLTFERSLGTGDWNYPWDLAGCVRSQ